jgi:hypothetical protein
LTTKPRAARRQRDGCQSVLDPGHVQRAAGRVDDPGQAVVAVFEDDGVAVVVLDPPQHGGPVRSHRREHRGAALFVRADPELQLVASCQRHSFATVEARLPYAHLLEANEAPLSIAKRDASVPRDDALI